MRRLLLLGRPGCHLCEDFLDELRAHPDAARVELEQACVDDRPEWQAEFGREIPVLLAADGSVVCRTQFDGVALARFLTG